MTINVLTLFPEMFSALEHSVIGRALQSGIVRLNVVNIRDFSKDKHLKCDDYPYGGGAGMVMTPQPIFNVPQNLSFAKGANVNVRESETALGVG